MGFKFQLQHYWLWNIEYFDDNNVSEGLTPCVKVLPGGPGATGGPGQDPIGAKGGAGGYGGAGGAGGGAEEAKGGLANLARLVNYDPSSMYLILI